MSPGHDELSQPPQESLMQSNQDSYRSANTFPVKMMNTKSWFSGARVVPNHLQLNITNKCNLKCNFCSCADRDLSQWLTKEKILSELTTFRDIGGKSVTIAGGGDPTVHPQFDEIIGAIHDLGIKIGLVTNGIRLIKFSNLHKLTWCRISLSYCNPIRDNWLDIIATVPVDWAFSFVYTGNKDECQRAVTQASSMRITHFRIVCDINNLALLPLPKFDHDDKVIYQPRESFTPGAKRCYISLMKPFLDVDGNYYPCCGVQYAREKQETERKIDTSMTMGPDFKAFSEAGIPFDGSLCTKCYYDEYNKLMAKVIESDDPNAVHAEVAKGYEAELNHMEFL